MDFKTAVEHEDNNKPIMYQNHQYYVVGHNELLGNVTIREASNSPMFTVPHDVRPEDINDDEEQD